MSHLIHTSSAIYQQRYLFMKVGVYLLESTILKIWEEYIPKTIDENSRKPTGSNAISGMIECFGMLMRIGSWLEYNLLKRWPPELAGTIYKKSCIDLITRNVGYPDTML